MAWVVFLLISLVIGSFGIKRRVKISEGCRNRAKDHLALSSAAREHGEEPVPDPAGPVQ